MFSLEGRVAVVTGGYGVLGGAIADGLAALGAHVVVVGRSADRARAKADDIESRGAKATSLSADVLHEGQLRRVASELLEREGRVDILVNAAGGNVARARTDRSHVFDLPFDAFDEVVRLNLHGTVYPSLVFGEAMARQKKGSIVSISSMAATRVLSGVMGYSVAKSAIDNFTRWMAVDLARRFGGGLRVNAIAPGFFVADQNRAVLLNADGSLTERGQSIVEMTPMGRFGEPADLQGAVCWLCSDAASFVTGTVIPVDGGFLADSGV